MSIPSNPVTTNSNLHSLIANRSSTRYFDSSHIIKENEIKSILEAARWSASSMNAQPWRFLFGYRGDKNFEAFVSTLEGNNRDWAPKASALLLVAVTGERITKIETYDAGLAVGALCTQALSMDLHTSQMGGFDRKKVQEIFSLASNVEPIVMIAIGKAHDPKHLDSDSKDREPSSRNRKVLSELILKGLE